MMVFSFFPFDRKGGTFVASLIGKGKKRVMMIEREERGREYRCKYLPQSPPITPANRIDAACTSLSRYGGAWRKVSMVIERPMGQQKLIIVQIPFFEKFFFLFELILDPLL